MGVLIVVDHRRQIPTRFHWGGSTWRAVEDFPCLPESVSLMCCGLEVTSVSAYTVLKLDTLMYLMTRVRNSSQQPLYGDSGALICAWLTEDAAILRIGKIVVDLSSSDVGVIRQNIEDALDTLE